jgi:hypothetical protein
MPKGMKTLEVKKVEISIFYFLFTFLFSLFTPLLAFDRSNVPLKNWGGFAVQRSWIYDGLEKLVLAGFAEEVIKKELIVLKTKSQP